MVQSKMPIAPQKKKKKNKQTNKLNFGGPHN